MAGMNQWLVVAAGDSSMGLPRDSLAKGHRYGASILAYRFRKTFPEICLIADWEQGYLYGDLLPPQPRSGYGDSGVFLCRHDSLSQVLVAALFGQFQSCLSLAGFL